jgi:hypothetical protein
MINVGVCDGTPFFYIDICCLSTVLLLLAPQRAEWII